MTANGAAVARGGATRVALLILLGLLWAVRLTAIKAAGLSGVPVHAEDSSFLGAA